MFSNGIAAVPVASSFEFTGSPGTASSEGLELDVTFVSISREDVFDDDGFVPCRCIR